MKTKLQLDEDILEAARALAETEKRPLGKVVSELARRGLGAHRPGTVTLTESPGFPMFEVPPNTPTLTSEMVKRALEDGG